MYAALATAWNLFSGYTGYVTLGQVAFFGIGAYALGITFEHFGIGSGYNPFYALRSSAPASRSYPCRSPGSRFAPGT